MKVIKTYKAFESSQFNDIQQNIDDILLELDDMGFDTGCYFRNQNVYQSLNDPHEKPIEIRVLSINIGTQNLEDKLSGDEFREAINDVYVRICEYMKAEGWFEHQSRNRTHMIVAGGNNNFTNKIATFEFYERFFQKRRHYEVG